MRCIARMLSAPLVLSAKKAKRSGYQYLFQYCDNLFDLSEPFTRRPLLCTCAQSALTLQPAPPTSPQQTMTSHPTMGEAPEVRLLTPTAKSRGVLGSSHHSPRGIRKIDRGDYSTRITCACFGLHFGGLTHSFPLPFVYFLAVRSAARSATRGRAATATSASTSTPRARPSRRRRAASATTGRKAANASSATARHDSAVQRLCAQ